MSQKDHQEKLNKLLSRRRIEEENQHRLEEIKTSTRVFRDQSPNYTGLEIGGREEHARALRQGKIRRDLVDSLDKQLEMKESERKMEKLNESAIMQANQNYQRILDERNKKNNRYLQNQRVYSYYDSLNQQRLEKQKDMEKHYIEEASARKKEQEIRKEEELKRRKNLLNNEIKQTLDSQVRYHSQQALENKKSNPEDNSYSVIGNMFRERNCSYDKKEYSDFLRRQAQEQNSQRRKWNFMN